MNIENICNEYFNCNMSYILDFIMVHESRFKFDYKYIDNDLNDQYISKNHNEIFKIYLDDKDSILNGMISVTDSNSYRNFSYLLNRIIADVISKRLDQGEETLDNQDWYFSDSVNGYRHDLLHNFDSETKFVEPNILSSKMVIKWIVLYIISRNCHNIVKNCDYFDLEDIADFEFQYNDEDDSLHLLVYTHNNVIEGPLIKLKDWGILKKWHFVHMYTSRRNVLDLDDWYEFDENNKPVKGVAEMIDASVNDSLNSSKDFIDVKKKERMKKLLKIMILSQMMNKQNK